MFCIRCGKQNVPDATFCYNCGTRLVRGEESGLPSVSPPSEGTSASPGENTPAGAGASEKSSQTPVAAVQEVPPPPPANPTNNVTPSTPNWPSYGAPSDSGPVRHEPPPANWNQPPTPPYHPYGYRVPPPNRVPLAPNGLPLPVFSNPENFYSYTNKEGKKVYAAMSPFGLRLGAVAIDTFLIYLVSAVIATIILFATLSAADLQVLADTGALPEGRSVPSWLILVLESFYLIYVTLMLWLAKGQTLGKRIVGIKVIKLDGTRIDFKTALLRSSFGFSLPLGRIIAPYGDLFYILNFALSIMVLLGFTSALWDKRRRGWHDKLADTIVVRSNELVQGVNY